MPQLRITITAPLPDEPLVAFRRRHDIEKHVLEMAEVMAAIDPGIAVTCDVEGGGLKLKEKPAAGEKRTRGPNKAKPAANGAEAVQGAGDGT